jgi:hypothetical protein
MNTPRFDALVSEAQKLTDKDRVLAKWPDAYSISPTLASRVYIYPCEPTKGELRFHPLGSGGTNTEAWADAARGLDGN